MQIFKEIWEYVCACFWTTVSIREKVKAVGSLIAALLALPMIWAIGGTLEATPQGVLWAGAWFTTSSLLSLFVISPFFLWREGRASKSVSVRLSCDVRKQDAFPPGSEPTKWIQVLVSADSVDLIDCEVQIAAIWLEGQRLYDEPLNCKWSNSEDIKRTIRIGLPQGANLFSTTRGKQKLYPETAVRKPQIFLGPGKYRIDVAVFASNMPVVRRWFALEYGGGFNKIKFESEEPG